MKYKNQSWRDDGDKSSDKKKNFKNLINRVFKIFRIKKVKSETRNKIFYSVITVLLLFALIGGISAVGVLAWVSKNLPDPNKIIDRNVIESTKIYDRTGENVLYEVHGNINRTMVELDEIPEFVRQATLAAEDKDFYKHQGFDLSGIARAIIKNILKGRKAQGASTITQQLIKNTILTSEKTYTRKLKELILAYRIEQKFTKDEILKIYLNEIPYGGASYGIEAASHKYFGKSAKDLELAEAVMLASLPKAPTFYSPYGNNVDRLVARVHLVLDQMAEIEYITKEEADVAKEVDIISRVVRFGDHNLAPHFVMYVNQYLTQKYGEKVVEEGGLKVYTTLDLYKQELAEEIIKEKIEGMKERYNANNASLIAIDTKTGQILTMVGSRDFFDKEYDGQVNVSIRLRQPGSSLKPIVFAAAFETGYTPDTILFDVETNFKPVRAATKDYIPKNYDLEEAGPISMRNALAGSLNIPAVKTYYLVGQDRVFKILKKLGYTSITDKERYGLGLVLGNADVKLLEHVGAYAALAREGIFNPLVAILKVEDRNGKVLEEFKEKPTRAIDREAVRMLNDVLSDNEARAFKFGLQSHLQLGSRPVAAKTGTTNDYRDAWTLGYTPSLAVGVWTGNNDNSAMNRGAAGGSVAAPIWHEFMKRVLGNTPIEEFNKQEKIETGKAILDGKESSETVVEIDRVSGKLATEFTPEHLKEKKIFKEMHSILYYVDKNDPRGDVPEHPEYDPQYEGWELGIKTWIDKKQKEDEEKCKEDESEECGEIFEFVNEAPPTDYDDLHDEVSKPSIKISYPKNNETINDNSLRTDIRFFAPRGMGRVEYFIDNRLVGVVDWGDYNLSYRISNSFINGSHQLKIMAYDEVDNLSMKTVNLVFDREIAAPNMRWISPSDSVEISKNDFPYSLKVELASLVNVKKVDLFYGKGNSGGKVIGSEIAPAKREIEFLWNTMPEKLGYYKLFLRAYDFWGNFSESDELFVKLVEAQEEPIQEEGEN